MPEDDINKADLDTASRLLDAPSAIVPLDDGGVASAMALESPAASTQLKYEVLRLVGQGGMGIVYLVHDRDLKRNVALKTVLGAEAKASRSGVPEARFVAEAQLLGQLEHPSIVAVHELGRTGAGTHYYTMPFIRGRALSDVLQGLRDGDPETLRRCSLTKLVQIFIQVTQAVAFAHERGVLHRDLKPANIMVGEHGEVFVLDWGLAKAVAVRNGDPLGETGITGAGSLLGTPTHMAPELIQGRPASPASDIYALGVILYQILTWVLPFTGRAQEIFEAHVFHQPVSPRMRAPDRAIPLELERATLRALAKDPAQRPASAAQLIAEVLGWLEAEVDRTKRRELAEAKAAEGRARLESYRQVRVEIATLATETERIRAGFKGWQTIREKSDLFAAEDRLAAARRRLTATASEVVATLTEALAFEGDNAAARGLLAEYYLDRLRESEASRDSEGSDYHAALVGRYHDGRYRHELEGRGTLALAVDAPRAEVALYRLVEEELVLVARHPRGLGTTPIAPITLAMGSYLAVLTSAGFRGQRYPVFISRNRAWTGHVTLYREEEVGAGFVVIPGGPFLQGGDDETRGWSLSRAETQVPTFFLTKHPVTMGEYLEFLNHTARRDFAAAQRRAPRASPESGGYLRRLEDGTFALPEAHWAGGPLDARMPVVSISWHDAVAFAAWRSARDGRTLRLVSDVEWEKAARGVDGRWLPWGDRFDPSLCNMNESRRNRPAPATVEAFPADVSVYGVRGLAGNVRDWTATAHDENDDEERAARVVRGGAWNLPANICRAANRFWLPPTFVAAYVGFRLAYTPARG